MLKIYKTRQVRNVQQPSVYYAEIVTEIVTDRYRTCWYILSENRHQTVPVHPPCL